MLFRSRIFLGWFSGVLFEWFEKLKLGINKNIMITAILNTFIHSVLVLGMIYVFFGSTYAGVRNIAYEKLIWVLMGIVGTNGILEALLAAFVVLAIVKAVNPIFRRNQHEK